MKRLKKTDLHLQCSANKIFMAFKRLLCKLATMKKALTLPALIAVFLSYGVAWGQSQSVVKSETISAVKTPVLYDPLFWRNQLKLSQNQQRKINEINSEFYERVKSVAARYPEHTSPYSREIAHYLDTRSSEIWSTFNGKQRKKWGKLITL